MQILLIFILNSFCAENAIKDIHNEENNNIIRIETNSCTKYYKNLSNKDTYCLDDTGNWIREKIEIKSDKKEGPNCSSFKQRSNFPICGISAKIYEPSAAIDINSIIPSKERIYYNPLYASKNTKTDSLLYENDRSLFQSPLTERKDWLYSQSLYHQDQLSSYSNYHYDECNSLDKRIRDSLMQKKLIEIKADCQSNKMRIRRNAVCLDLDSDDPLVTGLKELHLAIEGDKEIRNDKEINDALLEDYNNDLQDNKRYENTLIKEKESETKASEPTNQKITVPIREYKNTSIYQYEPRKLLIEKYPIPLRDSLNCMQSKMHASNSYISNSNDITSISDTYKQGKCIIKKETNEVCNYKHHSQENTPKPILKLDCRKDLREKISNNFENINLDKQDLLPKYSNILHPRAIEASSSNRKNVTFELENNIKRLETHSISDNVHQNQNIIESSTKDSLELLMRQEDDHLDDLIVTCSNCRTRKPTYSDKPILIDFKEEDSSEDIFAGCCSRKKNIIDTPKSNQLEKKLEALFEEIDLSESRGLSKYSEDTRLLFKGDCNSSLCGKKVETGSFNTTKRTTILFIFVILSGILFLTGLSIYLYFILF